MLPLSKLSRNLKLKTQNLELLGTHPLPLSGPNVAVVHPVSTEHPEPEAEGLFPLVYPEHHTRHIYAGRTYRNLDRRNWP